MPTSVEGIDPIPVCSVAPSAMNAAACSAIARSASVGGGSVIGKGALSDSIRMSIWSVWSAWRWSGGRPKVVGNFSETSTTQSRPGSAAAR
jgi:hypothetical protein